MYHHTERLTNCWMAPQFMSAEWTSASCTRSRRHRHRHLNERSTTRLSDTDDWLIDLGPGAGHDGGRIVFEGTPAELVAARTTLTGEHLAGYVGA